METAEILRGHETNLRSILIEGLHAAHPPRRVRDGPGQEALNALGVTVRFWEVRPGKPASPNPAFLDQIRKEEKQKEKHNNPPKNH